MLQLTAYIAKEWIHSPVFYTHIPIVQQQMNVYKMYGIIITDIAHPDGFRDGL